MSDCEILLVTFPAVGHVNPSLQFAKRLVAAGVKVTLVTSNSALPNLTKTPKPDGLTFATFSDGYDDGFKPGSDPGHYMAEIKRCCSQSMTTLITSQKAAGKPFARLVYTLLLPWAGAVARELHLPSVLLWIQPATLFDIYYHNFNGYEDVIKKLGDNPSSSIKLPGLPLMTINDFPSFFHPSNKFPFALPMYKEHLNLLKLDPNENPKVLVNTFDALESNQLTILESVTLISVGPLVPTDHVTNKRDKNIITDQIENFLNSKPEASVIYISYGSISELPTTQVEKIARGLVEADRPFLWVLRSGEEGLSRRRELEAIGMIVAWCDQARVLAHAAVGCFVTHGGWNSAVEAVAAGVAVAASPQWADQKTNAKLMADEWGMGVRMEADGEGVVASGEVRRCVEAVIGEGGAEMRRNAKKWRELAREAVAEGGSSDRNIKDFVREIRECA